MNPRAEKGTKPPKGAPEWATRETSAGKGAKRASYLSPASRGFLLFSARGFIPGTPRGAERFLSLRGSPHSPRPETPFVFPRAPSFHLYAQRPPSFPLALWLPTPLKAHG